MGVVISTTIKSSWRKKICAASLYLNLEFREKNIRKNKRKKTS